MIKVFFQTRKKKKCLWDLIDNEVLDKQLNLYIKRKWRCGPTRSQSHSVSLSSTLSWGWKIGTWAHFDSGWCHKESHLLFLPWMLWTSRALSVCKIRVSQGQSVHLWAHIHLVIDNGVWLWFSIILILETEVRLLHHRQSSIMVAVYSIPNNLLSPYKLLSLYQSDFLIILVPTLTSVWLFFLYKTYFVYLLWIASIV